MRISGLYYLFQQHSIMSTFTREQHATIINDKLREAILGLDKKGKKCLLKAMAKLMENMKAKQNAPPQRVDVPLTSECVFQGQRVGASPPVTTTTNCTAPEVI